MKTTEDKLAFVDALAKLDSEYQTMLEQCRTLEKQVFAAQETLPSQANDLVWDFIMLCESMSQRKLWLACRCLDIPPAG